MSRTFAVFIASLTCAGAAAASSPPSVQHGAVSLPPGPPVAHVVVQHDVVVRLPPGPCRQVGGLMSRHPGGENACTAPQAALLPPGPCAHAGGMMAQSLDGHAVCVRRGGNKAAMDDWEVK